MRIAFVGTRGVPATYSGFETFVEQLGKRLVNRGHEVSVYCRRHHAPSRLDRYEGMRLVYVPGWATKHLDTITHSLTSCLHAWFQHYDVMVMCISGNSPLCIFPRLGGTKVVLNVDGSDWRRKKWGPLARAYIKASEWLATRLPNVMVTDSLVMHRYYLETFGKDSACIPYGADVPAAEGSETLRRLGIRPGAYILLVGRLVPENCADHLVDAYADLETDLACVVVGDAPYARQYLQDLKRRGKRVIFPGYVFGEGYRELLHNAYVFVLCSEVGGTHPVLVEAMAAGNCVVVNGTPANLEVIDGAGLSYDGANGSRALRDVLVPLLNDPARVERYRQLAAQRAKQAYSWDTVTNQYEEIFEALTGSRGKVGVVRSSPDQRS
jgi:glycosyltransferase involved in cell wall biosynthesis